MFSANVEKVFDAWIKTKFNQKPTIKNFLLNHQRKSRVIDNVCEQIVRMENYMLKPNLNLLRYRSIIESSAQIFAQVALAYAEDQHKSSLAKMQNQIEEKKLSDAQAILDEAEKEALSSSFKTFGGI